MGNTLIDIRAAIARFHINKGYLPIHVVVSAAETLPTAISGVITVRSKDLNPGDYRINDEPNHSAYWAAALRRHRERIAAGCISAVGAKRVSGTTKDKETTEEEQGENV